MSTIKNILITLLSLMDEDEKIRESAEAILNKEYPNWRKSDEARNQVPRIISALTNSDAKIRQGALKELLIIDPEWSQKQQGKRFSSAFFYSIRDNIKPSSPSDKTSDEIAEEFSKLPQKMKRESWNINKEKDEWDSNDWEGYYSRAESPYDEER